MNNLMKSTKCLLIIFLIALLASACQNILGQSTVQQNSQSAQKEESVKAADDEPAQLSTKDENSKSNSGLLIGLSKDREANKKLNPMEREPDDYRTLWISYNKKGLSYIEKKEVIVTPVKDEFWKVQNQKFNYSEQNEGSNNTKGNIFERYNFYYNFSNIVSYIASDKAKNLFTIDSFKKKYLHDEEGYMGESFKATTEWLGYVGNEYACVMSYYYETGGGSYASEENEIKLYHISDLGNLQSWEKSIKLVDLLASNEKAKLKDYSLKYNKTISSDKNYKEEQVIDNENLTLKRIDGQWKVQIPVYRKYQHQGNGSSGKYIIEFVDTNIKLPKELTSYDTLSIDWNMIKQKIPEAKDAVTSPNKNLLAVLTPTELLVYTDPEIGIDKPSLRIPVDKDESIILNQWATAEFVDSWDKQLKSY